MAATLSNIKIKPCTVTWNSIDLGYTDGEIEVSFEEKLKEIMAHQEGENVLTAIRTGHGVEVTVTLKESAVAVLKNLFDAASGSPTPGAGTEVLGWGSAKDFTPVTAEAQKLVLHPIANGASLAEDMAFWKAYPMIQSLNLSGESETLIPVTFKIFPDLAKESTVRLMCIGDHTQDLDA